LRPDEANAVNRVLRAAIKRRLVPLQGELIGSERLTVGT
jgi:hypothetical protein